MHLVSRRNIFFPLVNLLLDTPVEITSPPHRVVVVDPNTYPAVIFPPSNSQHSKSSPKRRKPPLLVVLHGAGANQGSLPEALTDLEGEHAGFLPSLMDHNRAPTEATENFVVMAPYSQNKSSFYQDSRSRLLRFIEWAGSGLGKQAGCPDFDDQNIFLLGFSDGATVAVELATTLRFQGVVVASYGFTGDALPRAAVDRLRQVPMWVFHSADDVIFDVKNSDRLVETLRKAGNDSVRYSRFERDPEGMAGTSIQGHTMGITASKDPNVYKWMLSLVQ